MSSARKGKENYISITNATNQVIDQQIANTLINLKLDLFTTKLVIEKRIDRKSEMGNGASFDIATCEIHMTNVEQTQTAAAVSNVKHLPW